MRRFPPADHANHDSLLIAGHAAGDLRFSERPRAEALLQSCAACADLHGDLLAIATATHALPPIAATRDFRLDPDQAARLRRGSWLRGLLRPFGAAGSSLRPMAAAFTSLGVAGLLVATILPSLLGGAASAPALERLSAAGGAVATDAAAQPVAAGSRAEADNQYVAGGATPPTYSVVTGTKASGGASEMPRDLALGGNATAVPAPVQRPAEADQRVEAAPNPFVLGSLALLAVGLALFGLRFAARRVR
jgi:hypothetical protein